MRCGVFGRGAHYPLRSKADLHEHQRCNAAPPSTCTTTPKYSSWINQVESVHLDQARGTDPRPLNDFYNERAAQNTRRHDVSSLGRYGRVHRFSLPNVDCDAR